MGTQISKNRKLKRMFANILSIVAVLAIAFPAMGDASAQEPNPWFSAFPEGEIVEGWDWPLDAVIHMTIDDPATETSPDYWQDEPMVLTPWDPESGATWVWFEFPDKYDMKPGDIVTLSLLDDGTIERTHEVQNLAITEINLDKNQVFGTANNGQVVTLWSWEDPEGRRIETGGSADWGVDFDDIGFPLEPGYHVRAEVWVGGNDTAVDWEVRNPHFTVFPEWEWFDGLDWPDGANVLITVENKQECETMKESWDYFFNGSFGEGCDLEIGDMVTFKYGETIRTHTVQNLTVTKANHDDDTIKGIADPGAEVHVWPHATGEEQLAIAKVIGAAEGKWHVDFSEIYDLTPGGCGRSEIRDKFTNSTAVDWCISNPRIVASESGDWFWTTEFKPGDLDISIYDSSEVDANLLWSGQQVADESGFAFVGSDIHGQDLVPGNYLVISDGDSQKSLVLQPISVTMFDSQYEFMAGFAPAGSEVWAAAGPQDWQERIMVESDPDTGEWFANFAEIGFDITEDMQPWSYAHIYDDDGDANEGDVPPLELWVVAYTYDLPAGMLTDGTYPYHFELEWSFPESGAFSGQGGDLDISDEASIYDGYVLLRGLRELHAVSYPEGLNCEEVEEINPNQPMRFLIGWIPDYGMTYSEAQTYFENLTGRVVWDDGASADLVPHEIMAFSFDDLDAWFNYVCTFTADLILDASQPDWVDSGITVSVGESFTIEAFGLMNPCSDTYPNGAEYCIFYSPLGAGGVVPYENEFGVFPGPGLPFMALLGRIGDGEPFYVGEGGTFTAEQDGTLWFTPNDNLLTDNQGTYGVMVWLEQ